jgi:hypothetical protein
MKKLSLLFLTIFTLTNLFGQTDKNGNPIFNSDLISEEKFDNFELTSSYYNIKENISNKKSSVYVSDNPTLDDYIKFSRDLPATFFIAHKGQTVICMIMLLQKNDNGKTTLTYNIVNPNTKKSIQVPCNVWGEINEKRADELLKLKVDTSSVVIDLPNNGKGLLFNGIAYRIQSFDKLKAEIIEIVNQITSGGKPTEEIKDPEEYIKKETIGGKLDFNKALEKETTPFFLYDGIAYSKKDFAIYLWGKKVKTLGISSAKKASKLWEETYSRELTSPEKKALEKGFDSKDLPK